MTATIVQTVSGNVVNDYGIDDVPFVMQNPGTASALVAFIGWDVAELTYQSTGKAPAVNVTDSAGNLWRQIGISSMTNTSRCAIWIADNARQTQWVSVALTGWGYSTAYTIAEVNNLPTSFGAISIDFVKTTFTNSSVTSLTIPSGTATTTDICFGVVATGGATTALTPPSGWTGLVGEGGAITADVTTYSFWIASQGAGTVSGAVSWTSAAPASGVIVGLKLTAAAPTQPNPNFPVVVVEAAFGATPGDWTQSVDYTWDVTGLTWTDISTRVRGDDEQSAITISRGRQYELSQEETGEIDIWLDNHDGAFTLGNTASPYYPNVIPGVPIRITAWFNGIQYPVAFGYVERWPQDWPQLPQWGFSHVVATDAYGPLASVNLPSAVGGDIMKDYPYLYFPTNEQYSFTSQSLDPIKAPLDANGLIAVNNAFGNNRYGAYRDGFDQPVTVGQALNLLGDENTSLGAATYAGQEKGDNGPGLIYFDPNLPTNTTGSSAFSIEFWFVWGNGTAFNCTLFTAWGRPSSYYASTNQGTGGCITVGINTSGSSGLFLNGIEVTGGTFNQTTFAPQHFVLTTGANGTFVFYNGVLMNNPGLTLPSIPQLKGLTLGPARWMYDVNGLVFYNGYNFIAGHLAMYPQELTAAMVNNHYTSGVSGFSGTPAPGRFAQVLTWGLLGLKRGGTAWYGSHGFIEGTTISEAYSYQGSNASDIMNQLTQTEGGRCYTQGNGSIVYVQRWSRYNQVAVAIFGDNGTTEIPFLNETNFSVDNSFIDNQISATQNRGPNQDFFVQITNSQSQLEFFSRTGISLQSYAFTPFDVFDVVNWDSVKYNQPVQRVQQLSLDVFATQGKLPAAFPTILSLELDATVGVNRRPIGASTTGAIAVTGSIQQLQHEIGPNVWRTKYQIAPVVPENQALVSDVSGHNTLGSSYLSW